MRDVRREMQIVFQDPYASLNPRMTAGDIISEPLRDLTAGTPVRRASIASTSCCATVGFVARARQPIPARVLRWPAAAHRRCPRAGAEPAADHPRRARVRRSTSSIRRAGREPAGVAAARLRADVHLRRARPVGRTPRVGSRGGRCISARSWRSASKHDIYDSPSHPYTQALLSAVPIEEPGQRGKRQRIVLEGDVPSPANPPSGCRFRTCCWKAQPICAEEEPALVDRGQGAPERVPFRRDRAAAGHRCGQPTATACMDSPATRDGSVAVPGTVSRNRARSIVSPTKASQFRARWSQGHVRRSTRAIRSMLSTNGKLTVVACGAAIAAQYQSAGLSQRPAATGFLAM